ncbi:MAG TPA: L-threonylcarbamoyladenylate synthase [Bryobacteraceae bacterium]|nr:L-threonylcarbamoyladenylate synthase [Bryobacteraceae bacterium]
MSNLTIHEAAEMIRAGGLVAFPTETVYGLGANALDASAVAKIYEAKGRPSTSPLIVHASSIEMARSLVKEWPRQAQELATRWWPGPLTLVLPKADIIPDIVTAGLPTVGVRVPAHPVALELIEAAKLPLAAPSANRFKELSPTTAAHVRAAFAGTIPVLDGGPTRVGIESTVVAIRDGKITLLRPGMIALEEIETAVAQEDDPHPAPGMHARHYSPRTPLLIVSTPGEMPDRRGAYVWWNTSGLTARSVRMPADAAAYARKLYSVLHDLDAESWPWIAVEAPPETAGWAAIADRLKRAASK